MNAQLQYFFSEDMSIYLFFLNPFVSVSGGARVSLFPLSVSGFRLSAFRSSISISISTLMGLARQTP